MSWNRSKASRAKKLLQKKATRKEERKAAAMAAGMDWYSDESDDETPVSWVFVMAYILVLLFPNNSEGFNWFNFSWETIQEQKLREPPLPNLLKDEEHLRLILDVRISFSFSLVSFVHIFSPHKCLDSYFTNSFTSLKLLFLCGASTLGCEFFLWFSCG